MTKASTCTLLSKGWSFGRKIKVQFTAQRKYVRHCGTKTGTSIVSGTNEMTAKEKNILRLNPNSPFPPFPFPFLYSLPLKTEW